MSKMRTRSQPLSPSGFVSLETAPKARTNLRKRATKKNAAASNDAASQADQPSADVNSENPTVASASAAAAAAAEENDIAAQETSTTRARTTSKRTTRASSAAAENRPSKTKRTTRTTTTITEDREEEIVKVSEPTPAAKRGKGKSTAHDDQKIDDAARPVQGKPTVDTPANAAHMPSSPPLDPSADTIKTHFTKPIRSSPSPPPSQQQSQEPQHLFVEKVPGAFPPKNNEQIVSPINNTSHQPESTPPTSFSDATHTPQSKNHTQSTSFDDIEEPEFLSQPNPIARSPPLLPQSSETPVAAHSQSFSSATRPNGVHRMRTPYSVRLKRKYAESEGRLEKSALRISEMVKQNEEDIQSEIEQRTNKKRKERDIYALEHERRRRAKRRADQATVDALQRSTEERRAELLREEEEQDKYEQEKEQDTLKTPSPAPATPKGSAQTEKTSWLPRITHSVSRLLDSPFRMIGRTPKTESKVQALKGARSFTPDFTKSFTRSFTSRSLFSSSSPKPSQKEDEARVEKEVSTQKISTTVKEIHETSQQGESTSLKQQPKQSATHVDVEGGNLTYSLLPPPLDISNILNDDIIESIERSDTPALQSDPVSDDETIYKDGIPVWDSERPRKGAQKKRHMEDDEAQNDDQGGMGSEANSDREQTLEMSDGEMQASILAGQGQNNGIQVSYRNSAGHTVAVRDEDELSEPDPQDIDVDDSKSPAVKRIKRVRFDSSPQDTPSKLRAKREVQSFTYGQFDSSVDDGIIEGTPSRKHFAGLKYDHLSNPRQQTSGGGTLDTAPYSKAFSKTFHGETSVRSNGDVSLAKDDIEYADGPIQERSVANPRVSFDLNFLDESDASDDSDDSDIGDLMMDKPLELEEIIKGTTASIFQQSFSASTSRSSELKDASAHEQANAAPSSTQLPSFSSGAAAQAPSTPKKDNSTSNRMGPPATPSVPPNYTADAGRTPGRHDPAYLEKISKMRSNAEKYKPKKSSGLRVSSETPEGEEQEEEIVAPVVQTPAGETTSIIEKPVPNASVSALESSTAEKAPEYYTKLVAEYENLEWPSPQVYSAIFSEGPHLIEGDNTIPGSSSSYSSQQTGTNTEELCSPAELVKKHFTTEDTNAATKLWDTEFERFWTERGFWEPEYTEDSDTETDNGEEDDEEDL